MRNESTPGSGEAVGPSLLELSSSKPRISAKELEVLNEIARTATLDLELRPTLQRITDALMMNFGWEFVACILVDLGRQVFVCEAVSSLRDSSIHVGYTRMLGSGVVGEVATSGQPILLDDVRTYLNYVETMPGTMSELCVPVKHAGKLVAVLNLESVKLGEFHDQLPLLETVAEQIAGAIANARLYEEVRRRARLMEMMSEVTRLALDAGELDPLLDQIVTYVQKKFDLLVVSVFLIDGTMQNYALAAAAGETGGVEIGSLWPLSHGIVGRCLRSGQPELVPDVTRDPDYFKIGWSAGSEYVVPIRFRGELLGAFNFEGDSEKTFAGENQIVFQTIADQMAGAIHLASVNHRLIETGRELEKANRDLQQLSVVDSLTSVFNRRRFDEVFDIETRRARREQTPISLMMIDIDLFKDFNDAFGHLAGDECLRQVAQVLRGELHRAGDFIARYGGEEFVIVLPSTDREHAARLAENLRQKVASLIIPQSDILPELRITISIGVATLPIREETKSSDVLAAADLALYRAKVDGRNRVCIA